MTGTINTIVFDMDGTVLDTLDDLTESVNYVLRQFGFASRTKDEYRKFFGNGIKYAIRCAVPKEIPESVIDEMIPVFKEHYDVHCLDRTGPYDGILETLKALKENGYKMAIVSNKIDSAVKELNSRFFGKYVDVAIGEQPGIRRKPAPDMVSAALTQLGSNADESVYVGDSEVDLETARNAGSPCISVLWGFRDRDFLIQKGAKTIIEKPKDILRELF